jgi:hypothetical protein
MIRYIKQRFLSFLKKRKVLKEIRKIEDDLLSLSWYLGVEKQDDDNLVSAYHDARTRLEFKKKELLELS